MATVYKWEKRAQTNKYRQHIVIGLLLIIVIYVRVDYKLQNGMSETDWEVASSVINTITSYIQDA